MRILILNWRCPSNPKAGGAEALTQQVATRLVANGDEVEWFSASFPEAKSEERVGGIHIVRAGSQATVHLHAASHYRGRLKGRFDLVVDEINTIPFFSPLWAGIPTLTLIFQLAREIWRYETAFPLSAVGYRLEPILLRPYRRLPAITISASTKDDLRRLGFSGPITVASIGIESPTLEPRIKPKNPTFLYVGRLTPSKRVEDIVEAVARFRRARGVGRLLIIGEGDSHYTTLLRNAVRRSGLQDAVEFLGRLPTEQKHQRMAEAHLLLMASVREGWGLVVTEANACGTPAVVYDVPGLRDAVRNGDTGLLVNPSPESLARGMLQLWDDPQLYGRLAEGARAWSTTFSFDETLFDFRQAIDEAVAAPARLAGHTACL